MPIVGGWTKVQLVTMTLRFDLESHGIDAMLL